MPDVTDNAGAILAGPSQDPQTSPSDASTQQPAPQQATTPPAPPVNPALAASVVHHATFGAAVKNLLGSLAGQQTTYAPNPQTGQVEETSVPAKPGQFFRNLLAGMLIGGAAGSESGNGGFLGGVARGGSAAMQNQQAQDQQKYQRARQAQADTLEQQKADDAHNMHLALLAHTNVQITAAQQQLHNLNDEQLAKKNASAKAYDDFLKNTEGAQPVRFPVNGEKLDDMSAPEFMAAYVKDPSILHASSPDYVRHFTDVNDATELHYAGAGKWVDDAGEPVRLADSTIIRAYDIPTRSLKTGRMVPGSTILKIRPELAGTIDPDHNYSVTPEAISGLYTLELKDHAEAGRAAAENALANERATRGARAAANNARIVADIESKRASAFERANRDYQKAISVGTDPDEAKSARDQARQDAQTAYDNSVAALKGQGSGTPQGKPTAQTRTNAQPAGGKPAPEGTRIRVGDQILEKRNGQWVTVQGQ